MRVIAGTARRLSLMTPKGRDVRPTTDRIKETLFNMIQQDVPGSRFLDLFAGSGGIGIEALSRGAGFCAFVDADRQSVACVRANLAHTHLEERARVLFCDFRKGLARLRKEEPFDIIFLDPPYGKGLENEALLIIEQNGVLADDGVVIIETGIEADYTGTLPGSLVLVREKKYKTNKHLFLRKENHHL